MMDFLRFIRASRRSLLTNRKASVRSTLLGVPAALALLAAGSWQPAQALLTYNIFETPGGDVVVETNGSLNLPTLGGEPGGCGANGGIISSFAFVCTGPAAFVPSYRLIASQTTFNGTVLRIGASSVSGIFTHLNGSRSLFFIDSTYTSGTPIVSSATFNNTTLRGLGFTTTGLIGTWTLEGTGDQIEVVLTEVPGPLPLLGAGAAFGFSRRLRRRIRTSQATPPQA
jgi:hypothetical protein